MGSLAHESKALQVFGIIRTSAHNALRDLRPEGLTSAGANLLLDEVITIEKAMAGLKLLLADRAAESSAWRSRGARSAAADLASRSGSTMGDARRLLDAAKKVKDQPQVEEAVRGGELSEPQAAAIVDAVDANPAAATALLDKARTESLRGLRDECGRAKAAADRDEEATNARIHASRCFHTGRSPDGAFTGSFRGTIGDGARFQSYFQPFRDAVFERNRSTGRRDTSEAMDFDALLAMAEAAHAIHAGSGQPGDLVVKPPAQVNVVVQRAALLHGHQAGEESAYIAGLGPVPVSVVREIMEDVFLVGAVMEGTEVATIKRFGRYVPLELHDALRLRDTFRCTTPGCDNWLRLEMDHVQPYAREGETSYANLEDLCDVCHPEKTARDRLFDDTG